MKKIIAVCLACVLVALAAAALGDGAKFVTVQEWLDAKGECGDCMLLLRLSVILNPVLAVAEDETGSVNLFSGSGEDSMIINFMGGDGGPQPGDILVIGNPRYNEFEGTAEMADWTLLRYLGASGEGNPADEEFVFWDGIRWTMTKQEVTELSGRPLTETDYNGFTDLFYTKDLDGFRNDVQMFFLDDGLVVVQCAVGGLDAESLGRLEDVYRTRYGEPAETGREEFAAISRYMKAPTGRLPEDESCYTRWEAAGNTRIVIYKADSGNVFIVFASPLAQ